jgi:L-arabinose isomerase
MKKDTVELWFITGSQHLYGEETLKQVNADSKAIAAALDKSTEIPLPMPLRQSALRRTVHPNARDLLHGCILFRLQRCGYQGLRS